MFKRYWKITLAGLAIVALIPLAGVMADSAAIDFELPTYSPGSINGQDGWSSTGPFDQAVFPHSLFPSFGAQSLRISNAVTAGSFGDQTFSKSLLDEAGETLAENAGLSGGARQPTFVAEWDFASADPDNEQPGLSIVASPNRGDGARMSWVSMVDTPAGLEIGFYDYLRGRTVDPCGCCGPNPTAFGCTTVATGLDRTLTHRIKVVMDLIDGEENDVVKVYVNGELRHTGTSWEDFFRDAQGPNTRTVDSVLLRAAGTAALATAGKGFLIDNMTLGSGPGGPQSQADCMKDGWKTFINPPFTNQGQCIASIVSNNQNN